MLAFMLIAKMLGHTTTNRSANMMTSAIKHLSRIPLSQGVFFVKELIVIQDYLVNIQYNV